MRSLSILTAIIMFSVLLMSSRAMGQAVFPNEKLNQEILNRIEQYHKEHSFKPKTLDALLKIPFKDLHKVDLARMNILCASGLPGGPTANIERYITTLDYWAFFIGLETQNRLPQYQANPKEQQHFDNVAKYKMAMIDAVLKQDIGLTYNLELADYDLPANVFFANSQDIFIHGLMIDDRKPLGTCSNMPVLYAAIARRLGYPVKLVEAKNHLFIRWEDTQYRINFEVSNSGAMIFRSDEEYKEKPIKMTDEDIKRRGLLISFEPQRELAEFLSMRGICAKETGYFTIARKAYYHASLLAPEYQPIQNAFNEALALEHEQIRQDATKIVSNFSLEMPDPKAMRDAQLDNHLLKKLTPPNPNFSPPHNHYQSQRTLNPAHNASTTYKNHER